jgi:hypothetical protein
MMKRIYRIIVLDEIPRDLRERISALHASSLLQAKNQDLPAPVLRQNGSKQGKPASRIQD